MQEFENNLISIIDDDSAMASYRLTDLYVNCTESEREEIRTNWDFNRKWIWPQWDILTCKNEGEPNPIIKVKTSLLMNSISSGCKDYRETLLNFAIVYLSAPLVGLNSDKLFEEVAKVSTKEFALELRNYCKREPHEKSQEAFHFQKEKVENGYRFRYVY